MTLFGSMSMSADELYRRHIARALLESAAQRGAAERDAVERRAKCGRVCDGFEVALAERLLELIK